MQFPAQIHIPAFLRFSRRVEIVKYFKEYQGISSDLGDFNRISQIQRLFNFSKGRSEFSNKEDETSQGKKERKSKAIRPEVSWRLAKVSPRYITAITQNLSQTYVVRANILFSSSHTFYTRQCLINCLGEPLNTKKHDRNLSINSPIKPALLSKCHGVAKIILFRKFHFSQARVATEIQFQNFMTFPSLCF